MTAATAGVAAALVLVAGAYGSFTRRAQRVRPRPRNPPPAAGAPPAKPADAPACAPLSWIPAGISCEAAALLPTHPPPAELLKLLFLPARVPALPWPACLLLPADLPRLSGPQQHSGGGGVQPVPPGAGVWHRGADAAAVRRHAAHAAPHQHPPGKPAARQGLGGPRRGRHVACWGLLWRGGRHAADRLAGAPASSPFTLLPACLPASSPPSAACLPECQHTSLLPLPACRARPTPSTWPATTSCEQTGALRSQQGCAPPPSRLLYPRCLPRVAASRAGPAAVTPAPSTAGPPRSPVVPPLRYHPCRYNATRLATLAVGGAAAVAGQISAEQLTAFM